ncbi:ABC transporter substrate-binding protein [Butyrivibrio proteoclasticus]|uniref:ABC transporter substrate-binding protein n=1 Tax=Butyrivibrio proteoclasticus TaxID=43305 RepID=UPI0004787165|nr:ABC transporter substrate-binding protein [Butyrivibrio proteoclasticus]
MKKINEVVTLLLLLSVLVTGCGSSVVNGKKDNAGEGNDAGKTITVGFSQLGAESDWRNTNTQSMLDAFDGDGYTLIYKNGQQKQSNQITAIRMFIQQEVDYIVLAPATETGWDSVLSEAKEAGIPVIIVDRRVDVADKNLYSCWVGSDFELEGRKVAAWIKAYTEGQGIDPSDLHIVNIQGSLGSTAQLGRTRGLANAARENGWEILAEESGDFTETKGREVMTSLLKRYDNINIVYCENDNEAIGAIDAIESAGKKVGSDIKHGEIMVVSFDAVNEQAIQYAREGKISCIAECNPLHGPRVKALIETIEAGGTPEKFNYVDERIFSSVPDVNVIIVDGITYTVDAPPETQSAADASSSG